MSGWATIIMLTVLFMQLQKSLGRKYISEEFLHEEQIEHPKITTFEESGPRVNTTSGLLIGSTLEQSHAFYSIPYAEEPVR